MSRTDHWETVPIHCREGPKVSSEDWDRSPASTSTEVTTTRAQGIRDRWGTFIKGVIKGNLFGDKGRP